MTTLSKKDLFNAKNAGQKIEAGLEITIVAVGDFKDKDKDGKDVMVTAMKTEAGEVYTTISATINDSVPLLLEILEEEKAVTVRVVQSTSNSGRDFFQLQII